MTVAEKIKRNTKPLTLCRAFASRRQCVRLKVLFESASIISVMYQFVDGSKLTCRVYL